MQWYIQGFGAGASFCYIYNNCWWNASVNCLAYRGSGFVGRRSWDGIRGTAFVGRHSWDGVWSNRLCVEIPHYAGGESKGGEETGARCILQWPLRSYVFKGCSIFLQNF